MRITLANAFVLVMLMGCGVQKPEESGRTFYQDFRDKKISDLQVRPSFPDAIHLLKPEPEGLRIVLPKGEKHKETGVAPPFDLRGDFNITATYEILQVDYGRNATFEIYLSTSAPTKEALAFHRYLNGGGQGGFFITRLTTNGQGKRQDVAGVITTTPVMARERSGRLRIRRTGAEALLSAADPDQEFQELFRVPLGVEDIVRLRVGVNPRADRFADVRLIELNIQGQLISNGTSPTATSYSRRTSLWVLAGLLALGLLGAAFWTWRRRVAARARLVTTLANGPSRDPPKPSA
jgi:hypothetical protein